MDKAEMILKMLVDGMSVSAIERITGIHHGTILKLLVLAGERCEQIMGRYVRNVKVKDVEMDEVWSFIGKKEKRVRPEDDQNLGDAYCFVAIERNSKLVLNIAMRKRDQRTTDVFVEGVRDAIAPGCQLQITTDGFAPYKTAIPNTFSDCADFAMLITSRCSLRSIRLHLKNAGTRPLKFRPWRWSQSWGNPTPPASARR